MIDTDCNNDDSLRQESGAYIADSIERQGLRNLSTDSVCWCAETALQAALKTLADVGRSLDELHHNRDDAPEFDYSAFGNAVRVLSDVRRQVRAGVTL